MAAWKWRRRTMAVLAFAVTCSGYPLAQEPAFEVASIKPSPPLTRTAGGAVSITFGTGPRPGGRWVATNSTLAMLVQAAYTGFSLPGQIVGLPDWGNATRWEVNAVAAGDPPRDQMNAMVRRLLADRFKLKAHVEPRDVDAYALVLLRADGMLGRGIRPSTVDCDVVAAARKRGETPAPPAPGQAATCSTSSRFLPPAAERAASIFTALQEQLGLKLEARKEKLDVLVVEHVEMPTPD